MDFEVAPNGLLTRPSVHDGHLLGIELPEKHVAVLLIQNLAGQRFFFRMSGVELLLCDEFRQGNIIGAIIVTTGREPYGNSLERLLGSLHPAVKEPHVTAHREWVSRITGEITNGNKTFIEMTSAYGAQVFALCTSIDFVEA